jgi:hypothetical protein
MGSPLESGKPKSSKPVELKGQFRMCDCGKKAIKKKGSSGVCERCDKSESNRYEHRAPLRKHYGLDLDHFAGKCHLNLDSM